uniref:V-type ATP synthase subunit I n=1 Tax=candidate division WOR-3 bacterium TaxID=2052148 RepID=A0A7C6AFL7_UNCW3
MATVPLEKVVIVVHKSIKNQFVDRLHKLKIIHITELKEAPVYTPEELDKIKEAIIQIGSYQKKGILDNFVPPRIPLSLKDFEQLTKRYDFQKTAEELEQIKKEREILINQLQNLRTLSSTLIPFQPLKYRLTELKTFKKVETIPVIIKSEEIYKAIESSITDIPFSFEIVNTIGSKIFGLFFVRQVDVQKFKGKLIEFGCEIIDLPNIDKTPKELIHNYNQEIEKINKRLAELKQKEITLAQEIVNLKIGYDWIENEFRKNGVASALPETSSTVEIIGWIKKKDINKLKRLVEEFKFVAFERIEPEPDERPPVAIENPWWSTPYEMLIRLYSMPEQKEYDPTPFIAVFFPIFFALCLTDAIYGIFLALFSLYLMRKVPGDKSLLWILFAGGIITIFTGSMVGGWAGNLFDLIGIGFFKNFKKLMLFDPLTNPMPFFYLSLGIGYVHVLLGVLIEVFDDLRNKEYARAIFENLTWAVLIVSLPLYFTIFKSPILKILILLSVTGIILFSNRTGNPPLIDQILWTLFVLFLLGTLMKIFPDFFKYICLGIFVINIVRIKYGKKILVRIAWGLYTLYGITSFVSNILSYIRLMALGMVTGGIAVTVNMIAWMVLKVPVIGIILAIVVLIVGHSFNIVINALGGFIHTMRLHYIEFFGRFYAGGGRMFKPFGMETKYVEIK